MAVIVLELFDVLAFAVESGELVAKAVARQVVVAVAVFDQMVMPALAVGLVGYTAVVVLRVVELLLVAGLAGKGPRVVAA